MPAKKSAIKPHPYHHGNLRQALLDEAATVLERDGAEAISFRGLARALGVSHAAPGHHFADRNELLAELAADGYAGLADAMSDNMAGVEPAGWRRAIGEAYIRFGVANPERYRMMFASRLDHDCSERLRIESSRAYMVLLTAAYGKTPEVDPADYEVAIPELTAWSIVHGSMMLWLDGQIGSMSEAAFLEAAVEMVARFDETPLPA